MINNLVDKIFFLQDWIRFQTNNYSIILYPHYQSSWDSNYAAVETNLKYLPNVKPWEIHDLIEKYLGKEYKISYFHEHNIIEFFKQEEEEKEVKNLPFIPDVDRHSELIAWGAD